MMLQPAGMLWTFLARLDSDLSISSIPFIGVYSSNVYGSSALHQAVVFSVPEDGNWNFSKMFLVKDWFDGQSPYKQPSSNTLKIKQVEWWWNGIYFVCSDTSRSDSDCKSRWNCARPSYPNNDECDNSRRSNCTIRSRTRWSILCAWYVNELTWRTAQYETHYACRRWEI